MWVGSLGREDPLEKGPQAATTKNVSDIARYPDKADGGHPQLATKILKIYSSNQPKKSTHKGLYHVRDMKTKVHQG